MDRRRIGWMLAGMVGLLLAALVAVELPAQAQPPTPMATPASEIGGGMASASGLIMPPPPAPTPVDDGGDGGDGEGDSGDGDTGSVRVVERHTIWRILFPYETLGASIRAALGEMAMEAARDVGTQAGDGISNIAGAILGDTDLARGIRDIRRDVWRVGIVIAGILMPLSFMATVVAALRDGTTSVTGYANAREALLNWVIAAGAAVSSYFILTKGIELSAAGTTGVFERLLGTAAGNFSFGDYYRGLLVETAFMATPGVAQIFLAIFGMLLALALLASIGLALMAREVILILVVGVAPVMLIMGSMGPLRWLNGMWTKVTMIALLLGPANAFLIGSSALLALNAHQSVVSLGGMGGRIVGYLVALGIISVLIGLNTLIGKMVYGAVIEIAEKAWNGIMVVAGAAVGLGVGGLIGGAGVAAATSGSVSAGAATSSAGGLSSLAQATSGARAVGAIGQAVAATGVPGGRGLSAGMNAGAALAAHKEIKQGIAAASESRGGKGESEAWDRNQLSMGKAVDTAAGGMRGEIGETGVKGVLASSGISPENAMDRTEAGRLTARNMSVVGENRGVDMLQGLRELGVPGRVAQQAAVDYNRAMIRQMSLGTPSPFVPKPYTSLPREITARDMDTALQVVGPVGTGNVPSVGFLDNLVQTAYHRRIQLNEDPQQTIREAGRAGSLDEWMKASYKSLPNQGLAEDLRRGLGL